MRESNGNGEKTSLRGLKMSHGFIEVIVPNGVNHTKVHDFLSKFVIKVDEQRNYQYGHTVHTYQGAYPVCAMVRNKAKQKFAAVKFQIGEHEHKKVNNNFSPLEREVVTSYIAGLPMEMITATTKLSVFAVESVLNEVRARTGKKLIAK